MLKYEINIAWSADDGLFIAEMPELKGCIAHGATPEEALLNAHDAARLWLETAKELGRDIPKPKGRKLLIA